MRSFCFLRGTICFCLKKKQKVLHKNSCNCLKFWSKSNYFALCIWPIVGAQVPKFLLKKQPQLLSVVADLDKQHIERKLIEKTISSGLVQFWRHKSTMKFTKFRCPIFFEQHCTTVYTKHVFKIFFKTLMFKITFLIFLQISSWHRWTPNCRLSKWA